jgi:anti-sigma-K factor RskA
VMKAVRADLARPSYRPMSRAGIAWPAYAVTAAALVAAFVATLNNVTMRRDLSAQQRQVSALQQQVSEQSRLAAGERMQVADLFAPDSKHYPVKGGEVVTRQGRIYIALRTLPKLPPGKVFQVWTLARGAKAVAPSITFTPDALGSAVVRVPAVHQPLAAVAVSVEPVGGSKAPTSTPTFIRPLT